MTARPIVLFVGDDAGSTQIAESLLQRLVGDRVEIHTAGAQPPNPGGREDQMLVMMGLNPTHEERLTARALATSDRVIVLGTSLDVARVPGRRYEEWDLNDSSLEAHVEALAAERTDQDPSGSRVDPGEAAAESAGRTENPPAHQSPGRSATRPACSSPRFRPTPPPPSLIIVTHQLVTAARVSFRSPEDVRPARRAHRLPARLHERTGLRTAVGEKSASHTWRSTTAIRRGAGAGTGGHRPGRGRGWTRRLECRRTQSGRRGRPWTFRRHLGSVACT